MSLKEKYNGVKHLVHFIILIFAFVSLSCAGGESKKYRSFDGRIAVFDLRSRTLEKKILRPLTESIRQELVGSGRVDVMDRGNMERLLGERRAELSACESGRCIPETRRILGVAGIVTGTVDRAGGKYYLSFQLVDAETGNIEEQFEDACGCDMDELISAAGKLVLKLTREKAASSRKSLIDHKNYISPILTENSIVMGNPLGGKELVVFIDPTSPHCVKMYDELKKLSSSEPELVIYLRLYPLMKLHPESYDKARVIIESGSIEMLDKAFLGAALPNPETEESRRAVDRLIKLAESLGIKAAPTIMLHDGRMLGGFKTALELRSLL